MRGKITDQDLTDYALNELEAHDRLYVESMLAVSEECRHDVYEMIDLTQSLDEAFGAIAERERVGLTNEQRLELTRPHHMWWYAIRDVAAALVLAAGAAFAIAHADDWNVKGRAVHMAKAANRGAHNVAAVVNSPEMIDTLRALAMDPSRWLPGEMTPDSPAICTPPTWMDGGELTSFPDMLMPAAMPMPMP